MSPDDTEHLGHTIAQFTLNKLDCLLIQTADGSYSLRYFLDEGRLTEPMHSSKGAWSETLHIYYPALSRSLAGFSPHQAQWNVASIGLGLGYNEILAAALALKNNLKSDSLEIVSFESQAELRAAFVCFFREQQNSSASPGEFKSQFSSASEFAKSKSEFAKFTNAGDLPEVLRNTYQDIVEKVSLEVDVEARALRDFLAALLRQERLKLLPAFALSTPLQPSHMRSFNCILFDAFSPESSPDLWTMQVLDCLVSQLAALQCVFASYASRTILKKTLKREGFRLEKYAGFAGKRESTLAWR